VPLTFFFGPSAQVVIGTQFGIGFDYFVDPRLLLGFNARVGRSSARTRTAAGSAS